MSDDEHESVPQDPPPSQQPQESPFAEPALEEIGRSQDPPQETRSDG